jgi:copper transport protein
MTLLAVTLLAVRSWGSHAIDKGGFSVAVYTVHEVAAGLWLGSLGGLLLTSTGVGWATDAFSAAAERVSLIAGWCVAILIATGLFNAYQELGINLSLLRYSAYGRVILFKLATAAMVIAIGAYNRFRLIPSIDIRPAQTLLRRNVAIECVILIGVLYWSTILASTPPPH